MKTIVRIIHGSHLYGTNTPTSDMDYKSVHIPDARDILLHQVKPVISIKTKADCSVKNTLEDIDDESFSIKKYLNLIAVGDTMGVEILFTPDQFLVESTFEWNQIVMLRDRLINRKCAGFVGYCRKQAAKYGIKGSRVACVKDALNWLSSINSQKKMGDLDNLLQEFVNCHEFTSIVEIEQPNGILLNHWEVCDRKIPYTVSVAEARRIFQMVYDNYGERARMAETNEGIDWKAVSHACRVGTQAIELLTTGIITLPRPDASYLLQVKKGELPYKEVAEHLEFLLEDVEKAATNSSLPKESDLDLMDRIVENYHLVEIQDHYALEPHFIRE